MQGLGQGLRTSRRNHWVSRRICGLRGQYNQGSDSSVALGDLGRQAWQYGRALTQQSEDDQIDLGRHPSISLEDRKSPKKLEAIRLKQENRRTVLYQRSLSTNF